MISSNILVAKVTGNYCTCLYGLRGSDLKEDKGSMEPNKGSTRNGSLLIANHISVFTLSIVSCHMISIHIVMCTWIHHLYTSLGWRTWGWCLFKIQCRYAL